MVAPSSAAETLRFLRGLDPALLEDEMASIAESLYRMDQG